MELSYIIMLS